MDININDNNLPEEVILEILLRLPVKSLLRFRCVSKSWLSLISDPHFTKSHFELSASPSHRLIHIRHGSEALSIDIDASLYDDSASVKLVLPLPPSSFPLHIIGSCRGFILLDNSPDLFLWNPSTGAHKTLSCTHIESKLSAFTLLYGFGYDASTDDYLVVIALIEDKPYAADSVTQFEFLSLGTNSWTEIEGTHFPYTSPSNQCGLLFNGAIHWLGFRYDESVVVIIAFDLIERNSSEIPLPDDFGMEFDLCDLGVMGGCLSLCYDCDLEQIWVMKEYKVQSSWTKSILVSPYEIPTKYFSPVCFTKGGEIVGFDGSPGLVKLTDKGELIEHHPYCDDQELCRPAMYIESLLPLPSNCGEAREDDQQ